MTEVTENPSSKNKKMSFENWFFQYCNKCIYNEHTIVQNYCRILCRNQESVEETAKDIYDETEGKKCYHFFPKFRYQT